MTMTRTWTFGRKVGAGFAATVALAVIIGGVAIWALRTVVADKDRVISVHARLLTKAERLRAVAEAKRAERNRFLMSGDSQYLDSLAKMRDQYDTIIGELRDLASTAEARGAIERIERLETEIRPAIERVVELKKTNASIETVSRFLDEQLSPKREAQTLAINALVAHVTDLLNSETRASTDRASAAVHWMLGFEILAVLLAAGLALLLARTLSRQVGTAVQHVQSSSSELQAAANQQATGAKEQATAMNEIATTISELLASSRQIAESAQRVAHIAGDTMGAARSGDQTVQKAHESIGGIRRQVDLIVGHMLDLGRKSQQIGGILEIIGELAEQTNILAINATIEAAGAGEAGARFAVVADEIRKLAERVGGSTKEIRGLIDEIRSAVNTTVMATEGGSKAVEAGAQQFSDVAAAFRQIASLVGTTTEAAREIELSTKQQATAVEQVKVAVANVAQTTRETEASSNQTFQTAAELTTLSSDLTRLIQPHASA
jgi:methyl-accepting chemotaxis protein